jgi:hypothetical protein
MAGRDASHDVGLRFRWLLAHFDRAAFYFALAVVVYLTVSSNGALVSFSERTWTLHLIFAVPSLLDMKLTADAEHAVVSANAATSAERGPRERSLTGERSSGSGGSFTGLDTTDATWK